MEVSDTLILRVEKSKKKAFLEMLKWLDFVEIQPKNSVLKRFIKNKPVNVPLDYKDVVQEVMAHRYEKS
jgi:hypothetical protein